MNDESPASITPGRLLGTAVAIADEADQLSMAGFRSNVQVERKPDMSLVTEIDKAIERMARERLRTTFPGCALVGEEEGLDAGEPGAVASLTWYVDPIDATHNFVRGVPIFGTLLAAAVDGEIEVAVVSAPALGGRWVARRGGGAWRNDGEGGIERIRVSGVRAIEDSQLVYGSRTVDLLSGEMPGLDRTLAEAWRERGFGDFWGYMLVAEGAAEAMIETGAHTWDWAAPLLIVEEAGGRFTTAGGERRIDGASVVASNGLIHDELLRRLGRAG
jgi:histidinol-phosphatase